MVKINLKCIALLYVLSFPPTLFAMTEQKTVAMDISCDGDQKSNKKPDEYELYQARQQESYNNVKLFTQAIIDANIQEVSRLFYRYNCALDNRLLTRSLHAQLIHDFKDQLAFMKDKWPCEGVWIALELVIKSKQEKEDDKIYKKRLEILHFFVGCGGDLDSIPLRKYHPNGYCGWTCGLLCIPCMCVCKTVKGKPIHRAAQANNLDAFQIILENGRDRYYEKDGEGWTPLHYAIKFGADDVAAFLAKREVDLKSTKWDECSCTHANCGTLKCLACCFGTDIGKRIADDFGK